MVGEVGGVWFGGRVVPGRVGVGLAVDRDRVITGLSFPTTLSVGCFGSGVGQC